jgi:hypothetical protein
MGLTELSTTKMNPTQQSYFPPVGGSKLDAGSVDWVDTTLFLSSRKSQFGPLKRRVKSSPENRAWVFNADLYLQH